MSIRHKLLLSLLVVAFTTLALSTAVYFSHMQRTINEQVINQLNAVANLQHHRLRELTDYNLQRLNLISSRTQMRIILARYPQQQDPGDREMLNRILSDARKESEGIEELLLIGLDGQVVASASHRYGGESFIDHPAFLFGKSAATPLVILSGENSDIPLLYFSAPLMLEGRMVGVIAMQLDGAVFDVLLEDYSGMGESGEVLMGLATDGGGVLIFTPLRFKAGRLRFDADSPLAVPMRNALRHHEMLFNGAPDYRGETVIATTRYLERLGIGIVVKVDHREVMKPLYRLKQFMATIVVGMLILVLIASYLLSRLFSRPVIDIANVATRISKGDLSCRVEPLRQDELGILGQSINNMADNLIEANARLEQKVRDKTVELVTANRELERIARLDGLTGIANRRCFDERFRDEWRRSLRESLPLSLIMIDIDFFKRVNDLLGHDAGDICLRQIADLLCCSIKRPGDLVARFGGEEFVIILQNTPLEQAAELARRIGQQVIELEITHPDSPISPYVTVSQGVACRTPHQGEERESLLKAADSALYEAKEGGRNRVVTAGG